MLKSKARDIAVAQILHSLMLRIMLTASNRRHSDIMSRLAKARRAVELPPTVGGKPCK